MGKKLHALIGRSFKVSKFRSLVNLAISRLAVLKKQRQVKCSQAVSDVSQILQKGHHDRVLLRVEQVIKEQNMLDVLVMTEGYCNLLFERVHVIERERECPDELKEAISSLLFAASRIGEFPELNKICASLTSRYGKELAARSIELRNNCGVNPKMVQRLSTRQPHLEARMKVLKEIAAEKNIVLKLEDASSSPMETIDARKQPGASASLLQDEIKREKVWGNNYGLSDSIKSKKKYKDVADAAQEAFESAAYAAAAARAAVELSRSDSHDRDDHDDVSDGHRQSDGSENNKPQIESKQEGKIYPAGGSDDKNTEAESKRPEDDSSTFSDDGVRENDSVSFREQEPEKLLEKKRTISYSEGETSKVKNLVKAELGPDRFKGEKRPMSVRTRR